MRSPRQSIARHSMDLLSRAVGLHQAGRLDEAEQFYGRILSADKHNFDALNLLGMLQAQRGNLANAHQLLSNALKLRPTSADVLINLGNVLKLQNRLEEALEAYTNALKIEPNAILALNNRGSVLSALQRFEEARASFDAALKIKHDYADALFNRGNLLIKSHRFAEALADLDKARSLQPNDPQILLARGNALLLLARFDEAVAELNIALAIQPEFAEAMVSLGRALRNQNRLSEALASYDRALLARPDYAEALSNRGGTLHELRRFDEALASWDRALTLKPDLIEAWISRGDLLMEIKRYNDALAAYDKASRIKPDAQYLEGRRLHAKLMICDWSDWETEVSRFLSAVRNGVPALPFDILAIPSSPADQLACAKCFVADRHPPSSSPLWQGEIYAHDRIRVAYLSSDLREHPIGHLTAGLFEQHDRSRFELTAISLGPAEDSDIRRRIKGAFEHFVDARTHSDRQIAELIHEREIDIAVDLNGFTQVSRINVFASRAAPIQVNYLGYPGTMGADYIDYIIADRVLIPESQRQHYQEKVIYVPDCYQVNDSRRKIAERTPARKEFGLPEVGFVLCCFNNNYKITPALFDVWMRLLCAIDGSRLWLLADDASVQNNLRKEAAVRGIDPVRLIFASRLPPAEHLARHRLADLFLDTLPYNAHSTASDALWAGLPVLTCCGETFAGRVAASLLNAVGHPNMVTHSLDEYEALALKLGTDPGLLQCVRLKLEQNRPHCPLFDTARFSRHLEAAYFRMWELWQRGESPRSFQVEPLSL